MWLLFIDSLLKKYSSIAAISVFYVKKFGKLFVFDFDF